MSIRQLKQNKIIKDGRSWVFIQYSKVLDDKRHQYQSLSFITEEETTQTKKILRLVFVRLLKVILKIRTSKYLY